MRRKLKEIIQPSFREMFDFPCMIFMCNCMYIVLYVYCICMYIGIIYIVCVFAMCVFVLPSSNLIVNDEIQIFFNSLGNRLIFESVLLSFIELENHYYENNEKKWLVIWGKFNEKKTTVHHRWKNSRNQLNRAASK